MTHTACRPMPPGMRRLLAYMQTHPTPADADTLANAIHVVQRQAQYLLRQLHTAEPPLVHIAAWRKDTGAGWRGRPHVRLWVFGNSPDAPKPANDAPVTVRARRVKRLRETYGHTLATRILYDSATTIHSDGQTYHKRQGHGRQGAKIRDAA